MTQPTEHPPKKILARAITWPLLCGLLIAAMAKVTLATDPLYEVWYPQSFTIPSVASPDLPVIDATNFVVDNGYSFTVNFGASYINPPLFEPWNTLNYTNYGSMACNIGFQFDTQKTNAFGTTQHLPAANFFNPGIISCASTISTTSSNVTVVSGSVGEFIVNATNISMPGGTVTVGADGLISITGQNVDLSDSTVTFPGGGIGVIYAIPGASYAGFGTDTNGEWDPGVDLTATTATPSYVQLGTTTPASWSYPPGLSSIVTTTPYVAQYQVNSNRFVYQYVFLSNTISNVTASVLFSYSPASGRNRESDYAYVQFAGSGVNPATGIPFNNYILFGDNYASGANNPGISASTRIPNNFSFQVSTTPSITGSSAVPGFVPLVNPAAISNYYSYVEVHCLPTTQETNTPSTELTNYLSVLPGRIELIASSNLDLTGAQISGQNFLSISATNQLANIVGAAISSAYSDINVGVPSPGNLVVTNLVEPTVPAWGGTLAAWSTRFSTVITNSIITTDTNNVASTNSFAVTNDYNVVIIANQAVPSTPSAVWNLFLNGTNSTVISDHYNLLNGLYLNCLRLTLTTNGPGAQSPYGELNLQGTTVNWAAATPNLRYLTNNGVLLLPLTGVNSLGFFGSPSAFYGALVNNGQISDDGSQIWTTNFVNTGSIANGAGRFTLQSLTATMPGGFITAGGDVAITTGSLVTGSLSLEADGSLTVTATNQLADTGVTSGGVWNVGLNSVGSGINVPLKPSGGAGYGSSLLGTTINLYAPVNRNVVNVWAGSDVGVSAAGFANNLAVGRLVLDALGTTSSTRLTFNGVGANSAIYVDYLELLDGATNLDNGQTGTNFISLNFNSNIVIYYAQAVMNGHSVARQINHWNSDHLRWVPQYAGHFSSTNIVYPDGTTYTFNAALAAAPHTDSNQNGIPNAYDPTPFFVSSEVNFTGTTTNAPALETVLQWTSIPDATNIVLYTTNLQSASWLTLTNIVNPPAPPYAPLTNTVYDPVNPAQPRFYKVMVYPNLTDYYGPGF